MDLCVRLGLKKDTKCCSNIAKITGIELKRKGEWLAP